jgi:hypothetical protein
MCVLCGALWTEQHWAEVAAVEQLDTHERMRRMSRYRVAVDVGGTFTDLIVHDEESGRVAIAKTASIPADPAAAIMAALEQASIAPSDMAFFAHGSPGSRAATSRASRAAYGVWSAR